MSLVSRVDQIGPRLGPGQAVFLGRNRLPADAGGPALVSAPGQRGRLVNVPGTDLIRPNWRVLDEHPLGFHVQCNRGGHLKQKFRSRIVRRYAFQTAHRLIDERIKQDPDCAFER